MEMERYNSDTISHNGHKLYEVGDKIIVAQDHSTDPGLELTISLFRDWSTHKVKTFACYGINAQKQYGPFNINDIYPESWNY